MPPKTMTQSRTNRAAVAIVAVVATKLLAKYLPGDVAKEIANALSDEVVGGLITLGGAAVVYFRHKANLQPIDRQDVVTPRK